MSTLSTFFMFFYKKLKKMSTFCQQKPIIMSTLTDFFFEKIDFFKMKSQILKKTRFHILIKKKKKKNSNWMAENRITYKIYTCGIYINYIKSILKAIINHKNFNFITSLIINILIYCRL